ncbi:MAG: response regulator transcription factor [Polyangiaceae bacterium]|nr:response regulator transcription factor [Polyangiaceae bacterium]
MTNMSALVVEDEWPARNFLVELLRETDRFADIAAVSGAADAIRVLDAAPATSIDVLFADVRLVDRAGDTSGLDLAKRAAKMADPPAIVLATASPEHALVGFDLGAVDYLLKPFSLERVLTCVERLARRQRPRASNRPPPRLVARREDRLHFLAIDGLLAFEAAERLTSAHHTDGVFSVDLSLTALSAALGNRVLRVHRNWLVAPAHVRGLARRDGEIRLTVGDLSVPVARDRAREVRQRLLANTIGIHEA